MEWLDSDKKAIRLTGRNDLMLGYLCFWGVADGVFARDEDPAKLEANMSGAADTKQALWDAMYGENQLVINENSADLFTRALIQMLEAHSQIRTYETVKIETALDELGLAA
jgi:hypothetical protein